MEGAELKRRCRESGAWLLGRPSLVVIGWVPTKHMTNYACPATARFPWNDRAGIGQAHTETQAVAPRVVTNVLFADARGNLSGQLVGIKVRKVSQEPLLYLLAGNAQPPM